MFANCVKLTNTVGINSWDISKVTRFTSMFSDCPSHPEFTKGLVPGIAVHLNQQSNFIFTLIQSADFVPALSFYLFSHPFSQELYFSEHLCRLGKKINMQYSSKEQYIDL